MSAWKTLSPVLRGALTAAVLALAGVGLWLWHGGEAVAPDEGQQAVVDAGEVPATGGGGAGTDDDVETAAVEAGQDRKDAGEDTANTSGEVVADSAGDEESVPFDPVASVEVAENEPSAEASDEQVADAPAAGNPAENSPSAPLPAFDLVRIEPSGSAVIAGSAGPGDKVTLKLDGEAVAEAEADGQGAFVILTDIQPGADARFLTLQTDGESGQRRSEASVIVAPGAVAVAETDDRAAEVPDEEDSAKAGDLAVEETEVADAASAQEEVETAELSESETGADEADLPEGTESASNPAPDAPDLAAPEAGNQEVAASDVEPVDGNEAVAAAVAEAPADTPAETATAAVSDEPTAPEVTADLATAREDEFIAETTDLPPAETPETAPAEAIASATTAEATAPAAPREPQLLVASNEGLRVLQPSAEAAEVPLRVETIGYSESGVTLSGRGTGGPADLRIYLDNAPVALAPLDTDGTWEAELSDVDPGTYTLRVDQLAQDGKVTGRFETPFLRETEASLARAAPEAGTPEGLAVSVITVQPGYSLWAIASDRYGDGMSWHKVLEANKGQIRDPDLIYPGQIFDLPD
ncbi:LysM peptidoglycan-binding domain-containing protein [Vannielia litorea]|uniref:LysM peptidoglycan-binding domain-containing protein n=1 Tax=Vannielia litorea TaxID=1217970 RepID=UPI001C9575CA|nr:LysM peptidoglycan-binding domain-containing protein [Vannielia litorea]MBY6046775.1 LysM peptidoglycan-binding domain-containing protein [Vannielia litorea]MBY6074189.1 LysM peptidoglycan-binding domain-containing protein [Vannielia litorea]